MECEYYPATLVHNDHIHVIQIDNHFAINLKLLLAQFDMKYKDFHTYLFWKQERIVWIGFEKNEENTECFFARKEISKDVVKHILSFLRYIR